MKKIIMLLFLFYHCISLWSCTDEGYIYEDRKGDDYTEIITDKSKNKILSYKVINFAAEKDIIYSAVNHQERTITIYLPYYYQLQFMEVAIELPEGTTISPSEDELVPVFAEEPFIYEVKAADGTTVRYTVKVVVQQDMLSIRDFSTAENTATIPLSAVLEVYGENMLVSPVVTKLFLTDEEGTKIWGFTMDEANSSTFKAWFNANDQLSEAFRNLDTQKEYWLELECYSLTAKTQYPVKISL